LPPETELEAWYEQATQYDVDGDVLETLEGGYTGAVAVIEQGDGPTVGLRVDIDGLPRTEADNGTHEPALEGFRSEHEGAMHACGHDAHATIGVGVIDEIVDSDFQGTLKVFFQPAEEVIGGAKSMAKSEHIQDVEYLLALHIGLDHPDRRNRRRNRWLPRCCPPRGDLFRRAGTRGWSTRTGSERQPGARGGGAKPLRDPSPL